MLRENVRLVQGWSLNANHAIVWETSSKYGILYHGCPIVAFSLTIIAVYKGQPLYCYQLEAVNTATSAPLREVNIYKVYT